MEKAFGWMAVFSAVCGREARTISPDANVIE